VTTKRAELAKLRKVFDPEMAAIAESFFPSRETETAIEREIRERQEAERTARFQAMRDTRDMLLSGGYGAEAKRRAIAMVNEKGRDANATLVFCSKLASQVRKSAHYRNLALERKVVP
jgi:hypothetical protein